MRANVTPAAEGLDRRSSVVTEALRMPKAGVPSDDEGFELMEGEIAPMRAKIRVLGSIQVRASNCAHAPPLNLCDSA